MNLFEDTLKNYGDPVQSEFLNTPEEEFKWCITSVSIHTDNISSSLSHSTYNAEVFICESKKMINSFEALLALFYSDLIESVEFCYYIDKLELRSSLERSISNLSKICKMMPSKCSPGELREFRVKFYNMYLVFSHLSNQ